MIKVHFEPLVNWPRAHTDPRVQSRFSSTLDDTLLLMNSELTFMKSEYVVIQARVPASDIRQDGWISSRARFSDPSILVSFQSKHGPLEMACDAFIHWQDNLRGIAMTLNRLRLADLYGCTSRGEQYRGWAQLPAPVVATPPIFAGPTEAAHWMFEETKCGTLQGIIYSKENRATAYRVAAKKLHPDVAGGSTEKFQLLEEAMKVLNTIAPV